MKQLRPTTGPCPPSLAQPQVHNYQGEVRGKGTHTLGTDSSIHDLSLSLSLSAYLSICLTVILSFPPSYISVSHTHTHTHAHAHTHTHTSLICEFPHKK